MAVVAKGIDVSVYQGNIDFNKVKVSGVKFVMLRLGYGMHNGNPCNIDSKFTTYLEQARKAGLDVGCYFYSYALNTAQTQAEAQWVVNTLAKYKGVFTYPICFDLEDTTQENLGKSVLTSMVKVFCDTLEKAGYYTALYSNLAWLNYRLDTSAIKNYDIWLAQWASKPTYTGSFGMWQYSATGKINGITTDVDLDVAYKDYPSIIKSNCLNGFTKPGTLKVGDKVKINSGSKTYAGSDLERYVCNSTFKVTSIIGDKITLTPTTLRPITINKKDLTEVK